MSVAPEPKLQDLPDSLLEALGDAIQPAQLSQSRRDRMRDQILKRLPRSTPEHSDTRRAAENPWISIAPGLEVRELRRDMQARNHTSLLRMQAGAIVPPHRHEQEEEFIVLDGECYIGSHFLGTGDAHIAAAGSWHDAVTTKTGVLVLLRGEFPYPRSSPP